MSDHFLDFEQPIAELDAKIQALRMMGNDVEINIQEELHSLETKKKSLIKKVFSHLTDWQVVQLSRHQQRPHFLDYINRIFTDFDELHGDRHFSDSLSIIGGIARLNNEPVMVMGHQKGRNTKQNIERNFGMPKPEGYRKALRLMQMAERFRLPLFTFIDTPGAYPGIDAEERGQSEAIAYNLFAMSELATPIIATVIGEGGSGGALAIGVADHIIMLQYSIYSVISPEGCASILWKSASKANEAATALGITAERLLKLNLIDDVIPEPLGGAHRNYDEIAMNLKTRLTQKLSELKKQSIDELLAKRYQKLTQVG